MKKEINLNIYYRSGLYDYTYYIGELDGQYLKRFYVKNKVMVLYHQPSDNIEYDRELLAKIWKNELRYWEKHLDIETKIDKIFREKLREDASYFKPLVFDKEIAVECGLIPFKYKHFGLLLTEKPKKKDFSPRLDAYQTLTHKTIDRKSTFFQIRKDLNRL